MYRDLARGFHPCGPIQHFGALTARILCMVIPGKGDALRRLHGNPPFNWNPVVEVQYYRIRHDHPVLYLIMTNEKHLRYLCFGLGRGQSADVGHLCPCLRRGAKRQHHGNAHRNTLANTASHTFYSHTHAITAPPHVGSFNQIRCKLHQMPCALTKLSTHMVKATVRR